MKDEVVVSFSGGLDSTTLVYFLRSRGFRPRAIVFDYGQRHRKEIDSAQTIAARLSIDCLTVKVPDVGWTQSGSALTNESVPVPHGHYQHDSMRATVVPNRNMIFLALAAGHALSVGARHVAYAAHSGDHAIYADCRVEFIDTLKRAIALADEKEVELMTPFAQMTKGEICKLGATLDVPFDSTWSCYEGGQIHCGVCGTCIERREAFTTANIFDPTPYATTNLSARPV